MDASNTHLKKIHNTSFNNANYLLEFRADTNEIERVSNFSFVGAPSLIVVSLMENKIRRIEHSALAGLVALEVLLLSHNQIHYIKNSTFAGLASLRHVRLDHNRIAILVDGLFMDSPSIQELYLEHNEISAISGRMLQNQSCLRIVHLFENICVNSNLESREEITRQNFTLFQNCTEAYEILRAKDACDPDDPDYPDVDPSQDGGGSFLLYICIALSSLTLIAFLLVGVVRIRRRSRLLADYVINYDDYYDSESPYSTSSRQYSISSVTDMPSTSHFADTLARSYENCIRNSDKLRKSLNFKVMGPFARKHHYEEIK